MTDVSVSFVDNLPVVKAKRCLDNIHLNGISSDRYWLPWKEELAYGLMVKVVV